MHDNPQAVPPPTFSVPGVSIVALSGRDAVAFAQAQFCNDVSRLSDGRWQWSGWLTPKGRVIALFALLRLDAETLWLLLLDTDAETFATALRRFVFRSKVEIAVRAELQVSGDWTAPRSAAGASAGRNRSGFGDAAGVVELDFSGAGGARRLCIAAQAAEHDDALAARWQADDLRHGLPRLPAGQREHWTPQQLSLERLDGFSVKKGCYPGQEIVARTHFLGKAKRGLTLLEIAGPARPGDEVQAQGAVLGSLVSSVAATNGTLALAVLPLEREPAGLAVAGVPARELPLLDGLGR